MSDRSNHGTKREEAMIFLSNLSMREQVELFNEVLQKFQELELADNGKVLYKNTYLVSQLTYSIMDGSFDPADTLPLALPSIDESGYISDTLNQNGGCGICGTESIGFSKRSICPACNAIVGMT